MIGLRGLRGWWLPAALFLAPLVAALLLGVRQGFERDAWTMLVADSQFVPALASSSSCFRNVVPWKLGGFG